MWPYGWFALLWLGVIFAGGAGIFGRAGTQRLIDRFQRSPRVHRFLDRHHGEIRAGWHYVEFGALSWMVYSLLHSAWGNGRWTWWAALVAIAVSTVVAYLDEKRQELTPGRQFRWPDFWCSVKGLVGIQILIAMAVMLGS